MVKRKDAQLNSNTKTGPFWEPTLYAYEAASNINVLEALDVYLNAMSDSGAC